MFNFHHSIVIATSGRKGLLKRALESVVRQSTKPDHIIVVDDDDCDAPDLNQLHHLGAQLGLNLEVLANRRSRGASGAWNTAFDHLARLELHPEHHFVSVLDDDDWWDDQYLKHVKAEAHSGADILAAALSRHDGASPGGSVSMPPLQLDADDFLIGNPGIQGSNLTARLSFFLMAGLFDEALTSCTDRDICIRFAELRPVYRSVPNAIAHYDTLHGLPRLSDKAGDRKFHGLDTFHAKWQRHMTPVQYQASIERARRLFGWTPSPFKSRRVEIEAPMLPQPDVTDSIPLVVGIIADGSNPDRCRPLFDGLREFTQHPLIAAMDVVLLENGEQSGFQSLVEYARGIGLSIWPVYMDDQHEAGPTLDLQNQDITRSKSIAIARTLLQRFLFQVSHARNHAPTWILDDDYRLPDNLNELAKSMITCRNDGIDVVIGGNSGAAPVPASSLLRTQLVDIVRFLRGATLSHSTDQTPDANVLNHRWLEGHNDYHYDLTRSGTDRLETPFLPHFEATTIGDATGEAMRRAVRILAGEGISRPVFNASMKPHDSCQRGGNTLVLSTTLLRDIPNMSPRIGNRPTRRSDMLWAANARYIYGKSVKSVRLPMFHDRSMERADEDDTRRLVDDIVGYGFFRSYEKALRSSGRGKEAFDSKALQMRIVDETHKFTIERLSSYRLSFWRSIGLTKVLEAICADEPWWLKQASQKDKVTFLHFIKLLQNTTKLAHLKRVEEGVNEGLRAGDFIGYLASIMHLDPNQPTADSPVLKKWVENERKKRAADLIQKHLGRPADVLLGMGAEGVVIRVGDRVIKVFDQWTERQRQKAVPLVTTLRDKPTHGALPDVLNVFDWPEAFAVEYRFQDSAPYTGGKGPELVAMLRDLRRSGWVHNNVSSKNLRITRRGLQLVDIGKSLEVSTPKGDVMMIRRAFLSWRFSDRPNLVAVMRAAMKTEALPELTGWRVLLEAVESTPIKDLLDQHIQKYIRTFAPATVLDYSCGKPRDIGRRTAPYDLTAFDTDASLSERWARDAPHVSFWNTSSLNVALTKNVHFDLIVCSLVLCAVDDTIMTKILGDVQKMIRRNGRTIVAVCDPAALHVSHTVDQTRHETAILDALLPAQYYKKVGNSANSRQEFHRSTEAYRRAFAKAGLSVVSENRITGFDISHLERSPEFLVFELSPLAKIHHTTSLLIKLCALEADTALHQVQHLERQLARPRAFNEVVLLIDPHEGPFPRAHCSGNLMQLRHATQRLLAEGVVDRVIEGFADGADAARAAHRWTGQEAYHAHCANGQPATAILAAFERCTGDYILHADADVLVARPNVSTDHIADAIGTLEANQNVVTISLPVYGDIDPTPRPTDINNKPFCTEAMVGWIAKKRLLSLRPLPCEVTGGRLDLPWHRMLDLVIQQGRSISLRTGSEGIWFAAPENTRKSNVDDHLFLIDCVEAEQPPAFQKGQPLVQGLLMEWMGQKRTEPMVVVICGRNVRPGAIDRCLTSLQMQTYTDWGAIVIDDASNNGSQDVLNQVCKHLGPRITMVRRRRRVGLLPNIVHAIRERIALPETIVVLLDLDDALADQNALAIVAEHHRNGADLTVGSMLRTDKAANYHVNFTAPRSNRGGNVWQHLRTFRKSLFDRIAIDDLMLDGQWIDLANDWAYMLPIVEMAQKPVWIRDTIYLHEPSTCRSEEERAARGEITSRIVAKPAYTSTEDHDLKSVASLHTITVPQSHG